LSMFIAISASTMTPVPKHSVIYRVAQNEISHQTVCNIYTTSGLILQLLEAA